MAIDFNSQELKLLLRQLERGNVVLFAGAGFSIGARNSRDSDPPLGPQLAEILASECHWQYEGEDLGVVYEQAEKHLGTEGIRTLLRSLYKDCRPAKWHYLVPKVLWYRIYTTNVDDVLENSFRGSDSAQRLDSITCPAPFEDQDMWFEHVQGVHLHGSVLDLSKRLTFSADEYAGQTATINPWYQALIEDMYSNSVVFVGSKLNEPPMYHYLALRSERAKGSSEVRAKSFVVTPNISAISRRRLLDQGYAVIDSKAEEFFTGLYEVFKKAVPSRPDLLKNRYPHQIAAISAGVLDRQSDLLKVFEVVAPLSPKSRAPRRELFFEGVEPTWEDIANGLDAERGVMPSFISNITQKEVGVRSFALVGHAGSGKSTLLRRLAFELAKDGRTVYFCKAERAVETQPIVDFISSLGDKHVYMFLDDAIIQLEAVDEVAQKLDKTANVTFVLADRPHVVYPRLRRLRALKPVVLEMPYLDKPDCERIITKLGQFGMLGELRGRPLNEQLRQFLARSRKQLLVAMMEATSGRGFNVILENEFRSLSGENARMAYTITCIVYMHGAPIHRRHLLASMTGTDLDKANILTNDLREVIVPWNGREDLLCPRHRLIAHQVATESAPVGIRAVAVVRLLTQLSADLTPYNISRRTPEFIAYRGIINFDNMLALFGEDYEVISGIYNELKEYYGHDFLFWLQFGRAEVYFDQFAAAENYLNQSLAIRSVGNFQAMHYLGVLFLKRARYQENLATAEADLQYGEKLLRDLIPERGEIDAYPYAALVAHKYRYFRSRGSPKLAEELEKLFEFAEIGIHKHPTDEAMQEAYQEVMRAYLMTAVVDSQEQAAEVPTDETSPPEVS